MNPKKEFESFAAAYILGEKKSFKIKGNIEQVKSVESALNSSKKLLEVLEDKLSDSKLINEALENKKLSAQKFKKVFGFDWPF